MNARVYRNTGADVPPVNDFSTKNPHPLQLFPEDRITITDTFLCHLAHCNLTPRRFRIVLSVFNQTLGFNKFEDDMNGVRLQQLTGILANHANSTVRELEQLNVLVTRQGEYGHYLAINFDFAQWGQQSDQFTPTIDPCFLLPEDSVSDTGLDLSSNIEEDSDHDANPIAESLPIPITVNAEQAVKQPNESTVIDAEITNELLNAIKTLTEKVAQLEQKIEQRPLPDHQQHQVQPTSTATIPTAAPKTKPPAMISTPNTQAVSTLRYPSMFNAQQCQQAATLIQQANDSDKAQLLLDMLAKRISNQHDPLRQPMRYLETLVSKLNNNQLSITTPNKQTVPSQPIKAFVSTTTSITGEVTPEPSEAERIQAEYQEASLDCLQMKRNITMLAEQDNMTFEESLLKLNLQSWWEEIKERFYAAKEALALLSGEQDGVVV